MIPWGRGVIFLSCIDTGKVAHDNVNSYVQESNPKCLLTHSLVHVSVCSKRWIGWVMSPKIYVETITSKTCDGVTNLTHLKIIWEVLIAYHLMLKWGNPPTHCRQQHYSLGKDSLNTGVEFPRNSGQIAMAVLSFISIIKSFSIIPWIGHILISFTRCS